MFKENNIADQVTLPLEINPRHVYNQYVIRVKEKRDDLRSFLQESGIASEELLVLINSLSLEDIIALKLELSSKILKNRFYGFDIWRNSGYIVKDALLKFAIANTNSKKDAAVDASIDEWVRKREAGKQREADEASGVSGGSSGGS